jgi:hypothetical protein
MIFLLPVFSSAAEVTLAWDANREPHLAGYKIYYDTSSGKPYHGADADQGSSPIIVYIEDLDDPNNPEYTLTGLDDTEEYFFTLTAFAEENPESGFSNEASTANSTSGIGDTGGGDGGGGGGGGGGGCLIGTSAAGLRTGNHTNSLSSTNHLFFLLIVMLSTCLATYLMSVRQLLRRFSAKPKWAAAEFRINRL